ncbi:dentin sialophosphoprotein isoform X2 [Nylanderia fulva]|uniref:dentin sialophosphoprotein isoform X2 n=1 Tax=Nylanderia fulva TaxID=613905 RepID=UPI0010FB2129|nr:dentin sialophosphoprotein isoform X2 [Nylanderia fulva]
MEFAATQIYEDDDDDVPPTQRISHTSDNEEEELVGTLHINSMEYKINKGITTIGRLKSCNIVLNDVSVSKKHAEIEVMKNQGSKIWICDLKSSNKTKLDDEPLIPSRFYEIRDGSVIQFGKVNATYHTYRSTVIPETPAPSRQNVTGTIIPSTPDSSLNNSSSNDGSFIYGTQKEEQNNVFRRPLVPQQRQSTSIDKKNISHTSSGESDEQTTTVSHASNENREASNIFDMETQKFEEHEASNSIYDTETQVFPADTSIQVNTKANKQLQSKLNDQDQVASTSATNIYDMETQHYTSKSEARKSEDNICKVPRKKLLIDMHDGQTQNYVDDTDKDGNNTKNSEIDKNENQKKNLDEVECNINDLETQKLNNIAEDISNVETQFELTSIRNKTRNIFDMETQLDGIVNNDQDNTDKDTATKTINEIKDDNVMQSCSSRSSTPGSLNLSSPGVDKDCSLLEHSDHLLESSDLLEYFGEGLDKQEEIQASNTSTPKSHGKGLLKRDNTEDNNEDNIFDVPTQCNSRRLEDRSDEISEKDASPICKFSKEDSKESIDDEIDTKKAKKQCESLEISNKSCSDNTDNKNDAATSSESVDIFDALTQSNNSAIKDTSNSSVNQLSKNNETDTVVDSMAPTQIINNDENTDDQGNLTNKLLGDINSNDNAIEDGKKKHADHKKTEESIPAIADDSLEQKLSEMFENVNSNNIHEPSHISTQTLEDILESSECDNDLSLNTYITNENLHTDNVLQTQLGKKNTDTEANNAELDSQNSDNYFSTLTTRRKRNILKDTQDILVDSVQNVTPHTQASNTSQIAKVDNEAVDNNTAMELNKREKKISRSSNKLEPTTDTLDDDNVTETTSNQNNERNLRRSTKKRRDETTPEINRRVLKRHSDKVNIDDIEKDSGSVSDVCIPGPSEYAKRTRASDMYESDDDILTRLPAVRISGTLSNPASPSTSSTSTMSSPRKRKNSRAEEEKIQDQIQKKENSSRSNRGIVKGKNKETLSLRIKLHKHPVENSEKDESPDRIHDKPSVSSLDNHISNALETDGIARHDVDTSEDSDSETNYKRFKQMADRMLNNELDYLERRNKKNVQGKKKSARSSPNLSNNSKRNITDDEARSFLQTRVTRHSSRQNNKSLDVCRKETNMENETHDKSAKSEAKSVVAERKRTSQTIEKDVEQTNSRKRKAYEVEEDPILTRVRRSTVKTTIDRQSPSILNYFTSSRSNSPVIGSTRSSRSNKTVPENALEETQKALNLEVDENVDSGRPFIRRSKRKLNDYQAAMDVHDVTANNGNSSKQVQAEESKTEINLSQDKILKVVLSPLKSHKINPTEDKSQEDESQEVEMIMGRNLINVQDKNSSVRETNTAKIFQRRSRLRSSSQLDVDTKTDLTSTESSMSSVSDSNTQSDDSTSTANKHRRFTKSSTKTQVPKKEEIFKKPIRVNQKSSLAFDSSTENSASESSQNSIESDTLSSSRSLKSKVAGVRKQENTLVNRSRTRRMINDSVSSINTSMETTSLSQTPSTRMSRSMSVSSNSTPSAVKHKILFTGITEDYSIIIKTLGGNKVEDPAKCTILVTDKVRRTYKFLCALAKGVPIVAINWLKDSESAARFLDWESYILKDPAAEAKFGFRLRKSLDKAKEKKLLDGYIILLTSNIKQPPVKELKDMITSCGGKALLRPPNNWPENVVIISCEEDLGNAKKMLVRAPQTATIQSTEFILTGILKQETNFEKYRIT